MAIFQSLASSLKALAIGHRVKVTLRPETGRLPNPLDGEIIAKDEAGNLTLRADGRVFQVRLDEILSITRLVR